MENWKPVPGYEDHYAISDQGRVMRTAPGPRTHVGKINRPGSRRGYLNYTLSVNNRTKTLSAHRMVWEAFKGPISGNLQINHKNGNKHDNRLSNLELVTPSQNTQHAYQKLGLTGRKNPNYGTQNGRAKLTEKEVRQIRKLYAAGNVSQQALANQFGIHQTGISLIVRGKGWKTL